MKTILRPRYRRPLLPSAAAVTVLAISGVLMPLGPITAVSVLGLAFLVAAAFLAHQNPPRSEADPSDGITALMDAVYREGPR